MDHPGPGLTTSATHHEPGQEDPTVNPTTDPYGHPERGLPVFEAGEPETDLWRALRDRLTGAGDPAADAETVTALFDRTRFPNAYARLALVLHAPGHARILVTHSDETFGTSFARLLAHPRRKAMTAGAFRLQVDFIVEPTQAADFYAIGMTRQGARHFEVGVDGLLFHGPDGKRHLFLPGDAYTRSVLSMTQLRDLLHRQLGEDYLRQSRAERFRSESFLSGRDGGWLRLYRGYPVVGELTSAKVEHAVQLAIGHIRRTQDEQGRFLYYYDAALDSRRDHEHLKRDPDKNPYYNILRHGGGGLTCLYYEKWSRRGDALANARRCIDYLVATSLRVTTYGGREGAYVYSERKAKLGGAGVALYLLAEYQLLTGDDRYRSWADRLAWHLVNQVTETGEFIYYNLYLDRPVTAEENKDHFSFYYPGEAVCGLAKYLHLVAPAERAPYFEKLRLALEYLLVARPRERADQYATLPSDSWLMMGIMELWDFEPMRDPGYAEFVFADAGKMIAHMYTVTDAPCPDYPGAFYYEYGDFPYADGARCEGLLGAYALADKMADRDKMRELWPALRLAAWAVMHLVNTEDAVYFAARPDIALGGIRFKHTRQWFRIDTIEHVASFYAKMLPYWQGAEAEA